MKSIPNITRVIGRCQYQLKSYVFFTPLHAAFNFIARGQCFQIVTGLQSKPGSGITPEIMRQPLSSISGNGAPLLDDFMNAGGWHTQGNCQSVDTYPGWNQKIFTHAVNRSGHGCSSVMIDNLDNSKINPGSVRKMLNKLLSIITNVLVFNYKATGRSGKQSTTSQIFVFKHYCTPLH